MLVALGLLADALVGGDVGRLLAADLVLVPIAYGVGLVSTRPAAAGAVATSLPVVVVAHQLRDPSAHPLGSDVVFYGLLLAAPALAGVVTSAHRSQSRVLARQVEVLRAQRADDVRAARAEEHHRVEVTLHRGFCEDLAAIALVAEAARGDAGSTRSTLAACEDQARRSLHRLREGLGSLRTPDDPVVVAAVAAPRVPSRQVRRSDLVVATAAALVVTVELVSSRAAPAALLPVLATAGVVAVRRAHPATAAVAWLAVLVAWSAAVTPAPAALVTPLVPALLVAFAVGADTAGARRVVAVATLPVGVVVTAWLPADQRDPTAVPGLLLLVGLALLGGLAARRWSLRAEHLAANVEELRHGTDVQVRLARAEQRLHLAAELHDAVAHAMTVVCVQSAAAATLDDGELDCVVDNVVATARSGLVELRHGLDGLGRADDLDAGQLADLATLAGLVPRVEVTDGVAALAPDVRRLALRVVREGLVNAGRHAPGSAVDVLVDHRDGSLGVVVRDRPAPSPPPASTAAYALGTGTGLTTLAEAVSEAGGSLRWGPRGDTFELDARLRVAP